MTREELMVQAEALKAMAAHLDGLHLLQSRDECVKKAGELRAQAEAMPDAKAADYDWMDEARQIAAACWCEPETSKTQMDVVLAEVFAQRLAAWMWTSAFHARNEEYWRERALKAEAMPAQPDQSARIAELEGLLLDIKSTMNALVESDLGALWRWPDSAKQTSLKRMMEHLAYIDAALTKGEA